VTASTPRGFDPEVPSAATDLRRAMPVAARRGGLVAVLALGMGQIPPLIMNLAGAHLAVVTELRLGWLYTVASNVAPIRMERFDDSGGSLGIVTFRIGLLTITILVLWALAAAGARTAEVVAARPVRRAIAGAMVAIAYTAPLAALGAVVSLKLGTGGVLAPGSVDLRAAVLGVVALPLVLGLLAGAAGGLATLREREDRSRAALAGGWRMLAVALGLSLIGLLAIAALRPSGLQGYVDELTSQEPRIAALILGHQGLLLPNQGALVLVPAMGACDTVTLDGRRTDVVCLDREPRGGSPAAWLSSTIDASGSPPTRAAPWTVRLLLLVPAGAAAIGAWRAAVGARTVVEGVLRSVLAACVFAVLVGATVWASTITFTNGPAPGRAGSTQALAIGAPPLKSAGYALAWGTVAGGITGAVAGFRRRGDAQARPRRANPA
jgi:hypothetical protein